jgi:hypothetical protein
MTEWQHIGNQINAAMIFARSDVVKAQHHNQSHATTKLTDGLAFCFGPAQSASALFF